MLTTGQTHPHVSPSYNKDKSEIIKDIYLAGKISAIKNITNNKMINDNIIEVVSAGHAALDYTHGEDCRLYADIPIKRPDDWRKSVLGCGVKLFYLLTGIISGGALGYYLRYGSEDVHGHKWQLSMSPKEREEAKKIITIVRNHRINRTDSSSFQPKISLSEALLRTMAAIRLIPPVYNNTSIIQRGAGNDTPIGAMSVAVFSRPASISQPGGKASRRVKRAPRYMANHRLPACAREKNRIDYWQEIDENREKFIIYNDFFNGKTSANQNISTQDEAIAQKVFDNTTVRGLHKLWARDRWLHTFGLSDELAPDHANLTSNLIDILLSDILYRKYGLFISSLQFARQVALDIFYRKVTADGVSPFDYIYHGVYCIKQIFLRAPYRALLSPNESELKNLIILRTNVIGAREDNFLSYLEFVVNGQPTDIVAEFERLLIFFDASQDINDAYISMVKNRLAAALFPLMAQDTDSGIRSFVQLWMDGAINERLVGFTTPEGKSIAPGIIAIARSSGGLLVSLATSEIYYWTPDDTSAALKAFIAEHLSVMQKVFLASVTLSAKLDESQCVLASSIILIEVENIWMELKTLHFEKLDEHLGYHALDRSMPQASGHDDIMQQRLLASGAAVALLAFFFTGGSSAGCAAMMLSNILSGASGALYIHSAINTKDAQRRKNAWESALLSIVIAGLAGAPDLYLVMKTWGNREYGLIYRAADTLRKMICAGSTIGEAEAFIKSETRERTIKLLNELVKANNAQFGKLGRNSVEAMLAVLRICCRFDVNQHQYISKTTHFAKMFSQKKIIIDKSALASIPAGYELAVTEHGTNNLSLLLLCLGKGKFAGFNVQALGQSLDSSLRWEVVHSDYFNINNEGVLLTSGRSGTVYVEDSLPVSTPAIEMRLTDREGELATKLRRYCNRFKFDDKGDAIFSGVERFAINNGFDDVRFRALFIFDPAMKDQTARHYLLAANQQGTSFILEPNAENLRFIKIPAIEDVAILTEEKWRLGFENSAERALITYKDFPTLQSAMDYHPTYDIAQNNEKLLMSPPGFIELMQPAQPVTYSLFLSQYDGAEQQLLLQKKIRAGIIKDHLSQNSYEFILSVMKNAGVITKNHKELLLDLYKANPQDALLQVIKKPIQIKTFTDMLRIEPGKLVRFTNLQDSTISHLMLSVGNGRFAGMNNNMLDRVLSDEKRVLIAEQLGTFRDDDVLHSYGRRNTFMVEKGDLPFLITPEKSLMNIAESVSANTVAEKSSTRFALEILVAAKQLVPQQADALERLATLMTGKLEGEKLSLIKFNKFLAVDRYVDNNSELEDLAAGKLVVFYTEDKNLHTMVSLGENRFMGINNHMINDMLKEDQRIISSQEMGAIISGRRINNLKNFKVAVGDANLEKTRISALLGPDGRIEYVNHGLNKLQMEIKAHGALASINHYDAIELADIIRGLHGSLHPEQSLSHIELISCFGALGGRRSSAQIISDRLGTTVVSYRGVITDSKSRNRGSGIMFEPRQSYGMERIRENELWHRRIHDFIEDTMSLFGRLPFQRHSRAVADNVPFAVVVIDILHFLRKEIDAHTLVRHYPGLMSKRALLQAGMLASPLGNEETLITALLIIFYGNSAMIAAMEAYILSSEYGATPSGPVVINSRSLRHPLYWKDMVPALSTYRQLPSVVVSSDLISHSNIYIYLKDDKYDLREYMIRVGSDCNSKKLWPLLVANFFKEHSGSFPIMSGLRNQDILSMGFEFSNFHFFLNSWVRSDFSLHMDLATDDDKPDASPLASYVHFSGDDRRFTDTREDIGLGHSLLVQLDNKLLLYIKDELIVDHKFESNGSVAHTSAPNPLPSIPRAVITLVENRERFVMLQRVIPKKIAGNHDAVAFFLAKEINKYTQTIKLGVKKEQSIVPVRSAEANVVYSDPGTVNKSWILINFIHND
ncbi:hypothetical protein [Acerihabitans arboris]|uniref:Tox-PLDMTX domain-containing protein n=1 Tax=Acerihabitans arboris TaxID=2691583 RepID=A0A845SXG5_9GAMM|nr:hypothetical protein [Acerihabitans arboris]NDL65575.1 hypothetical protein [Acerihabitans arboris]